VQAVLARIDHLSRTNSIRIKEISGVDPVAEAILVDLAGELDKAAWMLRVHEG
jgi:DNA-binding ferritin-like protein